MRYFALLLLGCLTLPVHALTQVDIYHAEAVIDRQLSDAESMARQQGMKDVIVRATGSDSSLQNPVIQKALESSSRYISQLGYGRVDGKASLKMQFNGTQIQSLLNQAQLPSWSPNRANILVWMVEEESYDRTIAWENSDSPNIKKLRRAAETRGLPVTIPVGDFDDVTGIEVSDVWGDFITPIAQASQRYPVDALLILRVQKDTIRWTLYDQSPSSVSASPKPPRSGSATGEQAIKAMVNGLADYYAKKNAVVVTEQPSNVLVMKVRNVNSATDFFRLENTLKQLNSVASSEIKRVQGNELTLKLHLLASKDSFQQQAASISRLHMIDEPVAELTPATEMKGETTIQKEERATSTESADGEGALPAIADVTESSLEDSPSPVQPSKKPVQEQYDLVYEWQSSRS
ncbi:DUF2066 domain-containing protein [Vibrio mytili]|uniref:DUF2066 domain-containing protein n=1 Tax=Vibrio mytili TaxID=50718 RepID=UPI003C6FBB33